MILQIRDKPCQSVPEEEKYKENIIIQTNIESDEENMNENVLEFDSNIINLFRKVHISVCGRIFILINQGKFATYNR